MAKDHPPRDSFTAFARTVEPRLRIALVAAAGSQRGVDATVDTLAWAWEHWDKVAATANPAGYLYRVGSRQALRLGPKPAPLLPATPHHGDPPWIEPALEAALGRLSKTQRVAIVLIEGFDWTYQEVSDLLGVSRSTVQKHVERGMVKLRIALGVDAHV